MNPDQDDRYRCPYCGRTFPVVPMNTYHQAHNQCGLVPQEQDK